MRKHVAVLIGTLLLCGGLSSCLENKDNFDDLARLYDLCTITQNGGEYTIYSDMGFEIHPTQASVSKNTGDKGFGDIRRALMYFSYNPENLKTFENGQFVISNATYESGEALPCREPLALSKADSMGVTSKDSITDFTLKKINMVNGFLNTFWDGYYSINKYKIAVRPTLQLVYDPSKISADTIDFTLYYNRHDSINASKDFKAWDQIDCFDIVDLVKGLPSSDSVVISVKPYNGKPESRKFARTQICHPY